MLVRKYLLTLGVTVSCLQSPLVMAIEATELQAMRSEIAALRSDYEKRIQRLEKRLELAEADAKAATEQASRAALIAANAQDTADTVLEDLEDAETAPANTFSNAANAFNPALSMVLQGRATSFDNNPDDWHMPGFQLGGESGLAPRGLSLGETELTLSANVSDWFYAQATLSVADDDDGTEVGFEEAYADTLNLPYGLGLRFGRFYSYIAFQNPIHSHAWDFADSPLAYQAFLGGQYTDDGLRLSWLAPTDLFLEIGAEALRGDNYPGGNAQDSDKFYGGAHSAFIHVGSDIGTSHSFKAGLAQLYVKPRQRDSSHLQTDNSSLSFDGKSRLTTASLLYKWAPQGNPRNRNFTLETEYFHRQEKGSLSFEQDGDSTLIDYRGPQQGFYVQGVYQFRPSWRAGLRYDYLWSSNKLNSSDPGSGLQDGDDPYRLTAMVDFSHSEFGRFRLQYAYDQSSPASDNLWTLQYILSVGSHSAHQY